MKQSLASPNRTKTKIGIISFIATIQVLFVFTFCIGFVSFNCSTFLSTRNRARTFRCRFGRKCFYVCVFFSLYSTSLALPFGSAFFVCLRSVHSEQLNEQLEKSLSTISEMKRNTPLQLNRISDKNGSNNPSTVKHKQKRAIHNTLTHIPYVLYYT